MARYNGTSVIPEMIWSRPDAIIATDACLSGGGGYCGDQYFAFEFPDHIIAQGHHISVLEMWVVLLAIKIWSREICNLRLQIYCDNSATVDTINRGKCKDKEMLKLLREICFLCSLNSVQVRTLHIAGKVNRLADQLSRIHLKNHILPGEVESMDRIIITADMFKLDNNW